ncbi:hypothetical protein QBC36DRAFT_382273 [Triangularia setosa]|uniref:Uncharacterized protein n=1 Tax=Triangularia setosa TaxID=2587417 RepID=A0AAN6W158_9PEZI|nr:hypothetical protein QBC36DRAFT_382273 [Podospora setosa]
MPTGEVREASRLLTWSIITLMSITFWKLTRNRATSNKLRWAEGDMSEQRTTRANFFQTAISPGYLSHYLNNNKRETLATITGVPDLRWLNRDGPVWQRSAADIPGFFLIAFRAGSSGSKIGSSSMGSLPAECHPFAHELLTTLGENTTSRSKDEQRRAARPPNPTLEVVKAVAPLQRYTPLPLYLARCYRCTLPYHAVCGTHSVSETTGIDKMAVKVAQPGAGLAVRIGAT